MNPFTPSADRCETQVMTVLVSRLGNRSTSSAAAPGTEAARLFAKPSFAFLPIGAAARTTAAGRPTGDFANANMGAAGGSTPAGLASQGPAVMPQAAVARPSADQAKANVVAATRAASLGASSVTPVVTVKRPSVLPPPAPAPQPGTSPKIQPPTGPLPQSQAPATPGAAARGFGATTAAGQAASAAGPVGSGPPASGAVAIASPASPAPVTIGSASMPAATSASGAASMVGFSAGSPFSPILESELFADSESGEEPEYELSDTTILDVNPCLLLPLSGCNFLLIVASVIFFLGALYAYFDQESTPASSSTNTWLVYLFLHLETVFMVVSLIVFLVASVGFLGALRENVVLLDMYTTLHGSFITAELVFTFIVFFLPVIGREFVLSHITTELIVHYRDNPDYQSVRSSASSPNK
nr:angiomotin-like [Dermacentor andersoni]